MCADQRDDRPLSPLLFRQSIHYDNNLFPNGVLFQFISLGLDLNQGPSDCQANALVPTEISKLDGIDEALEIHYNGRGFKSTFHMFFACKKLISITPWKNQKTNTSFGNPICNERFNFSARRNAMRSCWSSRSCYVMGVGGMF